MSSYYVTLPNPLAPTRSSCEQGRGAPPHPTSRYQSRTLRCCWGFESVRGRQKESRRREERECCRHDLNRSECALLGCDPLHEHLDEFLQLLGRGAIDGRVERCDDPGNLVEGDNLVRLGAAREVRGFPPSSLGIRPPKCRPTRTGSSAD